MAVWGNLLVASEIIISLEFETAAEYSCVRTVTSFSMSNENYGRCHFILCRLMDWK